MAAQQEITLTEQQQDVQDEGWLIFWIVLLLEVMLVSMVHAADARGPC